MYVRMHVCICLYACACMYVYMYVCTYVCMCVCMYVYACMGQGRHSTRSLSSQVMSLQRSTTGCTPPVARSASLRDASSFEIIKPRCSSLGNGGELALLQVPDIFARMSGDTLPEVWSEGKTTARSGLSVPPSSLLIERAGLSVSAAAVSGGCAAGMVVDSVGSGPCGVGVSLDVHCQKESLFFVTYKWAAAAFLWCTASMFALGIVELTTHFTARAKFGSSHPATIWMSEHVNNIRLADLQSL